MSLHEYDIHKNREHRADRRRALKNGRRKKNGSHAFARRSRIANMTWDHAAENKSFFSKIVDLISGKDKSGHRVQAS